MTNEKSGYLKLDFFVAGIRYSLISLSESYSFKVPECHNKFVQNNDFNSGRFAVSDQTIKLSIENSDSETEKSGLTPIHKTYLWELFRDEEESLLLILQHSPLVKQLRIDKQYQNGTITVDLADKIGEIPFPLENLDILMIINWLAERGDIMFHASGVILDGKGYAFLGKSGAGKSTIASALAERCDAEILGEDQVILRWLDGQFWIFGTPWHRDINRCSAKGVPLSALYFLDRSIAFGKRVLSPVEGISRVLQTAFTPHYRTECMPKILDTLSNLAQVVPMYALHYPLEEDPLLYL